MCFEKEGVKRSWYLIERIKGGLETDFLITGISSVLGKFFPISKYIYFLQEIWFYWERYR